MKLSFLRFSDLSSPPIVYSIIWITMLYLFDLGVVNYYQETKPLTKILIFSSIITFYISWLILRVTRPIKLRPKLSSINSKLSSKIFKYTVLSNKIWILGFLLTAVIQKGFPLLWMLNGDGRTYADFGFSSVHGFLTSFYLFSLLTTFLLFLITKNKKYLKYTFLFFLYPILAINRGILILGLAQLFSLFMFFNGLNFKTFIKFIFMFFFIVYIFGVIGEFRIGKENNKIFYNLISEDHKELFVEKLPIGFTWSYIYFTASLANINYNIDKIEPNYYPKTSIATLVPSLIQKILYPEKLEYEDRYVMEMINPLINTFTYFAGYLLDFGVIGTIVVVFFLQIIINYTYIKARSGSFSAQLVYPVLLSTILLSIFTDYFMSLVIILEIILLYKTGNLISKFLMIKLNE